MKVYEFLKKAEPDVMATEIARIMIGMLGALGIGTNTPTAAVEWGVKCTAATMICLNQDVELEYYKNDLAKLVAMQGKAMARRTEEELEEEKEAGAHD